jgi:hypothetical protein
MIFQNFRIFENNYWELKGLIVYPIDAFYYSNVHISSTSNIWQHNFNSGSSPLHMFFCYFYPSNVHIDMISFVFDLVAN